MDMHEILEYVKAKQISIARFGDEEIDLMTGHSIPYQDYDEELAGRLKQIIAMPDNEKLLVCLQERKMLWKYILFEALYRLGG